MKYNTTYRQLISLKDTIIEIHDIKRKLVKHYENKYKLIELMPPLFLEEGDEKLIDYSVVSRGVALDLGHSYKVASILQSHTNWLRSMIERLEIKENEGVYSEGSFVWRDLPESPVSTTLRNEITIQAKIPAGTDYDEFSKEAAMELYDCIWAIANDIQQKFGVENIYPESADFTTSQLLENEMPHITPKEREISLCIDEEAFILTGAGRKMHSGKTHTFIPPQLYDLNNFHQLIFNDRINTNPIKVASVSILSNGIQLSDQLSQYGMNQLKSWEFYDNLIKQEEKILEIKINIPRIAMALLAKGHIAEVQAGVISEESNIIRLRHKLDKY